MNDHPWFSPNHKPGIPRQRAAGEESWPLRDHTGQVLTCAIRDQTNVGAGFDVIVLMNGEPQFSRRCADAAAAAYLTEAWRQDNARGGWRQADV